MYFLIPRAERATGESEQSLRFLIYGPYGSPFALVEYGIVLFFAVGLGIAPFASYVQSLMIGRHSRTVKTQRIHVYWTVKKRSHAGWAIPCVNVHILDDNA